MPQFPRPRDFFSTRQRMLLVPHSLELHLCSLCTFWCSGGTRNEAYGFGSVVGIVVVGGTGSDFREYADVADAGGFGHVLIVGSRRRAAAGDGVLDGGAA